MRAVAEYCGYAGIFYRLQRSPDPFGVWRSALGVQRLMREIAGSRRPVQHSAVTLVQMTGPAERQTPNAERGTPMAKRQTVNERISATVAGRDHCDH